MRSRERRIAPAQVNAAFKEYSEGSMKNILEVTEKPLVSLDFKGSFCSSTVDASLTMVMGDDMVKIVAWCAPRARPATF